MRNDWEIKFQKLTGLLARVRAQGADTAAEIIFIDSLINQYGAKCEAYAKKVEYSPYIKPGPFQLSKGRKDAVGLILARAEAGEVTYMAIAADLYGSGKVNGQEDAVNDSSWTERAANAGDSASADITSLAYYVGYGVTKNYTTSTKWGRIAIALGCQCDADVAEREKTMTTEEIADGKAAADQWLTDHK